MSKFVAIFRELASFSELINTQVEFILIERLNRNWLKVLASDCNCTGHNLQVKKARRQLSV